MCFSSKQGGAHERVLTTLLNEMDGIGIAVDDMVTTATSQKEAEGDNRPLEKVRTGCYLICSNKMLILHFRLLLPHSLGAHL